MTISTSRPSVVNRQEALDGVVAEASPKKARYIRLGQAEQLFRLDLGEAPLTKDSSMRVTSSVSTRWVSGSGRPKSANFLRSALLEPTHSTVLGRSEAMSDYSRPYVLTGR